MRKKVIFTIISIIIIAFISNTVVHHVQDYKRSIRNTNVVQKLAQKTTHEAYSNGGGERNDNTISINNNIFVDSDSTIAVVNLKSIDSVIIIKREPEESSLPVACEAFIDFQNAQMGFYKAAIPQDEEREIYACSPIEFEIQEGHQYTIRFIKQDGLYLKLCLTDDFTGENSSIEATTLDIGPGWGKRSIECTYGSVKITEFYNLSTQPYNAKVLIIGDSFIEGNSLGQDKNYRYAKLIKDSLEGNAFINGQGGATSADGLTWLNSYLLNVVNPQYAIVAFGMNENDIEKWEENMELISDILEYNSIIPIFVTITPSKGEVDNDIHMRMNEYIRQSGYLYIDAAKKCSQHHDGVSFDESMFIDDKIHPTALTHKMIYEQALVDVPELFK